MTHADLAYLCAAAALAGLIAYALLGGADFGGGVWDLLASGPRKNQQRHAIAHAMGPVWEANHIWLIFVLVTLFTCFPQGYSALCIGLFVPLHLTLLGIMLRGAAFIFRKFGAMPHGWGKVFGVASIISPVLLGASFGVVTAGGLRVSPAGVVTTRSDHAAPWLQPYSLSCGILALSMCAYLAAVYLVVETRGELREDFRRRAIFAGTATAALSAIVLGLGMRDAPWFVRQLFAFPAWPVVAMGLVLFASSAIAVFRRHYVASCACAAAEVAILLVGWGIAHREYVIYPDVRLVSAAAPSATLRFVLWSLPAGLVLVLPSMWLLFHTFKREHLH
jgi:cytochrome bd ubiquinol oxidase subunit II